MPLPEEGNSISFEDLNEELGNSATTELDLEFASEQFGLTSPHGMDELFGLSLDNFATSISSVSPTSIVSSSNQGESHTITYTSDGNFYINTENVSWVNSNINSGSSGDSQTFTLTTDLQSLNAAERSGTVTLESPSATNVSITVHQDDNDASVQIVRQTGAISYGHLGGEGEYY